MQAIFRVKQDAGLLHNIYNWRKLKKYYLPLIIKHLFNKTLLYKARVRVN